MENKYVILLGWLSLCSGTTLVLGMETWAVAEGAGVLSAQHWGRGVLVSTRSRTWGCPGQGCADSASHGAA